MLLDIGHHVGSGLGIAQLITQISGHYQLVDGGLQSLLIYLGAGHIRVTLDRADQSGGSGDVGRSRHEYVGVLKACGQQCVGIHVDGAVADVISGNIQAGALLSRTDQHG